MYLMDSAIKWIEVPIESVPSDRPLPASLYLKVANKFTLFRNRGETLAEDRKAALSEKRTNAFFQQSEWDSYLLDFYKIDTTSMNPETLSHHVRELLFSFSKAWEEFQRFDQEMLHKLQVVVERLAVCLKGHPEFAQELIRKYSDCNHYYANHSVNVAIYSILIGLKLGMAIADVKLMALSALCHNLGNMLVPKNVLHKKGPLTKEEWEVIRRHPEEGALTLDLFGAPREVIRVALEHHERLDNQGYPRALGQSEVHLFSKICAVADSFDAMTSARPYARALAPAEAIREMSNTRGKFDPSILNTIA